MEKTTLKVRICVEGHFSLPILVFTLDLSKLISQLFTIYDNVQLSVIVDGYVDRTSWPFDHCYLIASHFLQYINAHHDPLYIDDNDLPW